MPNEALGLYSFYKSKDSVWWQKLCLILLIVFRHCKYFKVANNLPVWITQTINSIQQPSVKKALVSPNTLPALTQPCPNEKNGGTVTCGDNHEAKLINVTLKVAVKRRLKQCFLEPLV